jgi:hypothetical protein
LSGNPSRLVQPPIKILSFHQDLHFWSITSIYLDLCDHVCLNRKWIIDEEVLSWIISLCDVEQSYIFINSWKKFKQQRSTQTFHIFLKSSPSLSSRYLSSQISIKVLTQNFLKRKFSRGYQGQNLFFLEKFHYLWAIP